MGVEDARVTSAQRLTAADFHALAARHRLEVLNARKIGFVAVRRADRAEAIETRWNGKETTNVAKPGDAIATNLDGQRRPLLDRNGSRNVYVIEAARFEELYEATGDVGADGPIYKARSIVAALPLPGGFDIVAPWGERQTGEDGFLLLNGDDVYGIARGAFLATYEVVRS